MGESNAGPNGRNGDLDEEEKIFNALPKTVRRALSEAPYKYGPMSLFRDKVKRIGAYAVAAEIDEVSQVRVRREAMALYGPLHPQADYF